MEPPQKYHLGDPVMLSECPSVGVVMQARLEAGTSRHFPTYRWFYQMTWPEFPGDDGWYLEEDLLPAPADTPVIGKGQFERAPDLTGITTTRRRGRMPRSFASPPEPPITNPLEAVISALRHEDPFEETMEERALRILGALARWIKPTD